MGGQIYMPDSAEAARILIGVANTANIWVPPYSRGLSYQSYYDIKYFWAHINGRNDPTGTPYWIWYTIVSDAQLEGNPVNAVLGSWVLWFQDDEHKYMYGTPYGQYALYDAVYSDAAKTHILPSIGIGGIYQNVESDLSRFPEGWSWANYYNYPEWSNWHNTQGTAGDNIVILASTVPITVGSETYIPESPQLLVDQRIATKDTAAYSVHIGTKTSEASEEVTVGSSGAEASYYKTKAYNVTAHWTSPVTGFDFNVPLEQLTAYAVNARVEGGPAYTYNFSTTYSIGGICQSVRTPLGRYTEPPSEYSQMTDVSAVAEIPLSWLRDQAATQTAGVINNDIFTIIYFDFIDSSNGAIIETKELDFTDLFGRDIDLDGGTVQSPNDDPSIEDTNRYTDNIGLTQPTLTATGVFNRCYIMDANGINDLCDYLYNADDNIWEEIIDGVLTRGNPIESLIDLRLYPFDIRTYTGAGTSEFIKFGRTDTGIVGTKLPTTANAVIDMGSCTFNREYNNFLDYHMTAELYIPFCGTAELPIDRILNKTVSVKMIVDFVTGACTAVVYANNIPIQYRQGVMGISIPMTATNSAEFGKSILGNLVQTGSALAGGIAAGAAGGPTAAAESLSKASGKITDFAGTLYNGSKICQVGSSSPQCSLFEPKQCYMLISIPTPMTGVYDDTFADLVGYACFTPLSTISSVIGSGFCVFDNVKLDIPQATEQERDMINSYLTSGVYM